MSKVIEIHKNICVSYYPVCNNPYGYDFVDNVKNALEILSTAEVGRRLIKKIADGKYKIYIEYSRDENIARSNTNAISHEDGRIRGKGADTFIKISSYSNPYLKIESPFFIKLAHELIHAYHNSYGKALNSSVVDITLWENDEEYNTIVGFLSKKNHRTQPKITENAIRFEHNLLERTTSYI